MPRIRTHTRKLDKRPVFVKQPFGLPLELSPAGMYKGTRPLTAKEKALAERAERRQRTEDNKTAKKYFADKGDQDLWKAGNRLGLLEADTFLQSATGMDDMAYKDARHDLSIAIAVKHPDVSRSIKRTHLSHKR